MTEVCVLGAPASSAERVAARLAAALKTTPDADVRIVLGWPEVSPNADLVVFLDDAEPTDGTDGRAIAVGQVIRGATRAGVRIFHETRAAHTWLDQVTRDGLGVRSGPLRKLYLASGESSSSRDLAHSLSAALGLPHIEPEAPGHDYEGWGPRYEALARQASWLIHTPTWHAAEALSPAADLVVLLEQHGDEVKAEFPSPQPRGKWRRLFTPWLNRYPSVEAKLLEREIARHAGNTPVLRILTDAERAALLEGLRESAGTKAI